VYNNAYHAAVIHGCVVDYSFFIVLNILKMIKSDSRTILFVLSILVLFAFISGPAAALELREIRSGIKSGFTRLVFQFEAPARYRVKGNEEQGRLSITFMETTSGLPQSRLNKFSPPIESIEVHQDGRNLVADVALSIPRYRMKAFTLSEPHRVVFDLYPVAVTKPRVLLNKLIVKESFKTQATDDIPLEKEPDSPTLGKTPADPEPTSAKKDPPVKVQGRNSGISTPAIPAEETSVETSTAPAVPTKKAPAQPADLLLEKTVPAKTPKAAGGKKPAEASGKFQQYLIVVFAGISIVILALVGFLLLQKKNSAEKAHRAESGRELKTTADIMASIDARIKEKFQQYEDANPE